MIVQQTLAKPEIRTVAPPHIRLAYTESYCFHVSLEIGKIKEQQQWDMRRLKCFLNCEEISAVL